MYKAPLDWGAGYSPACVTLRSLHSHALHPQAVSTLLPRLISTRIIPAGIHSHLTWSECACKYTVALIQLNYKTSKQGSTSCDTDAIPSKPGDRVDATLVAQDSRKGSLPPTAWDWHSTAGRDQLPGRAPQGFPLAQGSHCTLPASPTAKLSQKGNVTHPEQTGRRITSSCWTI